MKQTDREKCDCEDNDTVIGLIVAAIYLAAAVSAWFLFVV